MVFKGPTRPGTDVAVFRETGVSVPSGGIFKGPTRPGTDVAVFRRTGKSVPRKGGGRRISPSIDIAAQQEAIRLREQVEQQRIQDQIKQQEIREEQEQVRQEKIFSGTIAGQIQARPPSEIQPIERVRGIRGIPSRVRDFISIRETEAVRGEITPTRRLGLFAAGVGLVVAETPGRFLALGRGLVTHPIKTIIGIPFGFKQRGVEIGRQLKGATPELGIGSIIGEVAILKGIGKAPKVVVKTTDIVRTGRLTELPLETIVAPEFFIGQTFPRIKPGQTAGQLLKEFKPRLPGETRPAGFTAAPTPFARETIVGRGTSELPGVFQAPLVSPRFLRISAAEEKLFTTQVFETFRPSITRITPTRTRLAPGITLTTKQLQPLKGVRQFFEKAPKGEAIIPFIKTEKEAVIPFGTPLRETRKRFFIKFEGRRIPIAEFEALPVKGLTPLKGVSPIPTKGVSPIPTAGEITRSLSGKRVGRRGRVSPLDLSSVVRATSRRLIISSTGIGVSGRISPGVSRPRGDISSGIPPSFGGRVSLGVSFRPVSPSGITPISFISLRGITDPLAPPVKRRATGERKVKKVKVKKKKKIRVPIRPSFTGIVLGIEEAAIVSPTLGVVPGQIRGLRTGFSNI